MKKIYLQTGFARLDKFYQCTYLSFYQRPQLVKSLVIVVYFFENEMLNAVIINY